MTEVSTAVFNQHCPFMATRAETVTKKHGLNADILFYLLIQLINSAAFITATSTVC